MLKSIKDLAILWKSAWITQERWPQGSQWLTSVIQLPASSSQFVHAQVATVLDARMVMLCIEL